MIIPVAVQMFKKVHAKFPIKIKPNIQILIRHFSKKNIQNELNYKGMYYLCTKI